MKKMSICFVAPTIYPYYIGKGCGGAELQIKSLSEQLSFIGHKVFILTDYNNAKKIQRKNNVIIIKCPFRYLNGNNLHFFADSYVLYRIVKSIKADFIILKTPNPILFNLALCSKLIKETSSIKIFARDSDSYCEKSLTGLLYGIALRFVNGIVFQTNYQKKIFNNKHNIKNTVIRNIFIPPAGFKDTPLKDIEVLWVGTFDDKKQPEKLLQITKEMKHRHFTVISKATDDKYLETEKTIKSFPNVDYLGRVPFDQIQSFYNRAKVLICTSKEEGFPNVFLQAWYGKCAIISLQFRCDGILEKKNCGLVSDSIQKMIKDIDTLLDNETYRNSLIQNGTQHLLSEHNPHLVVSQYVSFLQSLKD